MKASARTEGRSAKPRAEAARKQAQVRARDEDERDDDDDDVAEAEEATGDSEATDDGAALERKIIGWARIALPIATVGGAIVAGNLQGPPLAVLVLAAGALVAVIATFWGSLRTLLGETALSGADAFAIAATSAEEEQKRAVLRALKDLEFERSVGKISEEDYRELVAHYRAEAKRLLRLLDERGGPGRARIEALVAKRLAREGLAGRAPGKEAASSSIALTEKELATQAPAEQDEEAPARDEEALPNVEEPEEEDRREHEADANVQEPEADEEATPLACTSCKTINDVDAVFCKKCGKRRMEEKAEEPS